MVTTGLVLIAAGALLHVWIFVLESLAWTSPRARATFGTTPEEARATRQLAFNQGFYNLFLALAAGAGVVLVATADPATAASTAGATLAFTGAGSMVAAGLVLALSDRSKLRAALVQAGPPLLGVALLAAGLATR